jgi:hypothetical protein
MPHKLTPRSTRCVFLGYSSYHKGHCCLDLSTNRIIVSRYVIFYEDIFPLTASPNLTDLDFLLEYSFMVLHHWDPTPPADSTTTAACQPAPMVPLGFEPLVAPLPAPIAPPGFLPHAASTTPVALRVSQASPVATRPASPTPATPRVALESPATPRVAATPPTAMDGSLPRE